MAVATGLWSLNGKDLYDTYGLAITSGNGQFLLFPERKESLKYDWAERNGVDIDLTTPRFKAKDVKLKCVFVASSEAEYWQNRNAFFNDLANTPGWKTWHIADHDRDYSVYYKQSSQPRLLSKRLKNTGQIAYAFELQLVVNEELVENETVSNAPVYLRDADGNLISLLTPGDTYIIDTCQVTYNGDYMLTLQPGENLEITSPYSQKFKVTPTTL